MGLVVRYAALVVGGLTFALGFVTAAEGRTGKVSESAPLAVVDQTEKLTAAYMLAGAVLLAGGVIACQFERPPSPRP